MSLTNLVPRAFGTYVAIGCVVLLVQVVMVNTQEPECSGTLTHTLWSTGRVSTLIRWLPDLAPVYRGELSPRNYLLAGYKCEALVDSLDLEKISPGTGALLGLPSEGTRSGSLADSMLDAVSYGPTAIKIAAGAVTDADSRAGLIGTWEPDADLASRGLPPGSNHIIYLEDGLFINPFRNVALIGIWTATAHSITLTPIDLRMLETGEGNPDAKQMFPQIKWDIPGTSTITWLAPDKYQEEREPDPRRRTKRLHDIDRLRSVVVADLLAGSWTNGRSLMDGATVLRRTPPPPDLRWVSRDELRLDGDVWQRK